MSNLENIIGKKIRTLRQKKQWSQGQAATQLNISIPAFSKIETGITDINMARLQQIANLFQVTVFEILYSPETNPIGTEIQELDDLKIKLSEKDNEVIKLQKKLIELIEEIRMNKG